MSIDELTLRVDHGDFRRVRSMEDASPLQQLFMLYKNGTDHLEPLVNTDGDKVGEYTLLEPIKLQHPDTHLVCLRVSGRDMPGIWIMYEQTGQDSHCYQIALADTGKDLAQPCNDDFRWTHDPKDDSEAARERYAQMHGFAEGVAEKIIHSIGNYFRTKCSQYVKLSRDVDERWG